MDSSLQIRNNFRTQSHCRIQVCSPCSFYALKDITNICGIIIAIYGAVLNSQEYLCRQRRPFEIQSLFCIILLIEKA